MITREEIAAETENTLGEAEQMMWLSIFRSYPSFRSDLYPDVATKLAAVEGIPAKQLLAALRKIEDLGSDTTRLEGGRYALNDDPVRDRHALVAYALAVLYDSLGSSSAFAPFLVVCD
jgi:hypothetical protein